MKAKTKPRRTKTETGGPRLTNEERVAMRGYLTHLRGRVEDTIDRLRTVPGWSDDPGTRGQIEYWIVVSGTIGWILGQLQPLGGKRRG